MNSGIFDFLWAAPHEERVVARDEVQSKGQECTIDTAAVNDSPHPFETGIACPRYNSGKWVIVEEYDDKESAIRGHARWTKKMREDPPTKLVDVSSCGVASLAFGEDERVYEEEE